MAAPTNATNVTEYLASLPDDRKPYILAVRDVILVNLPEGYQECFAYGMLAYVIPLTRYPKTYNKQPLMYAALGNQKNYMSVYLMGIYSCGAPEEWFQEGFAQAGKKLSMGKSCVRFKSSEDIPLDVIGQAIARMSVEQYIERYEQSRGI